MRASALPTFPMPILVIVSLALQILCAVHVVRTGRPLYWIWLLLIGSYVAVAVYALVAIVPDLRNDPRSRKVRSQVLDTLDPARRRRQIEQRLELADTVDNRRALAEESLRAGDHANAEEMYRSILKGIYATEPAFMLGLAQALAGRREFARARETLDALKAAHPSYRSTDGHLVYARCLEELGEGEAALAEYEVLARSYPGEQARYRYASLLQRHGRAPEARAVLADMLKRARHAPRYYRRKEDEWLAAARRDLDGLGPG